MGKAAVPVSPWLRNITASARAPAHFWIDDGASWFAVAIGVEAIIARLITASIVDDSRRS
jgi:hypothetical protein